MRVINGDVTLLKGCATKPSMYYAVQNADQLSNVFSSIAQNLANLRITHWCRVASGQMSWLPGR